LFLIKHGQISIALVCIVLGIMLAVQYRTAQEVKSTVSFQRVADLSQQLAQVEREKEILVKQVQDLTDVIHGDSTADTMLSVRMKAGLVSVTGSGIIVTIDDSKRPAKPGENPNLYIIHDDDILKVINELWAAGAEAISINEQRLVVNSEIRCAGPTLSVNNTRSSPPYELKAIGNPATLETALKMRGGVIETLQFWGIQINIRKQDNIIVPDFKGVFHFEYAKPVDENLAEEKKEGESQT
jgi:uncharacterized protein YlxW (UPF0749 family)